MSDVLALIAGVTVGDAPDPDVEAQLDRSQHGNPLGTLRNVCLVLTQDPNWSERLSYNAFTNEDLLGDRAITDVDVGRMAIALDETYKLRPGRDLLDQAVHLACTVRTHHPVRDWLGALRWDGKARLDRCLHRYLGAEDTQLNAQLGSKWFIGAVARIMSPGCAMHTSLVLVGRQGLGKSRACKALMPWPTWFCDTDLPLGSKDAYLQIQGVWIQEIAELHALVKAGNDKAKSFLSRCEDRYRRPYGRRMETHPRQVVFIGTTNDVEFLTDPTGSRRYWPVVARQIDLPGITAARDQLWAEAAARYAQEERWWLDELWERELERASIAHRSCEVWNPLVLDWAEEQREPFTMAQVLSEALGIPRERMGRPAETRVGRILRGAGYETRRPRSASGHRPRLWMPSETLDQD